VTQARIAFAFPEDGEAVSSLLRQDGWSMDAVGGLVPGVAVVASYSGTYPMSAVDTLIVELARRDADYVAVVAGRVDPSMDTPAPAWIGVGRRWRTEGGALVLPRGFRMPAPDLRTLVAAGMAEADAAGCVAAVGGLRSAAGRPGVSLAA
jgi:hypothetical protein